MTPKTLSLGKAALAAMLAILLLAPLGASNEPKGHWEYLGEDGRVWVPATPPSATYLPGPALGDYHNHAEMVAAMNALATSRPDLFTVEVVGQSVQGRDIVFVTATAPGDASGRTKVLYDGAHHGDEVIGSEILVRFLQAIAANYDSDPQMQSTLSTTVLHVVPMVNPDGIELIPTCSYYADCRKNANAVDLNRNYEAHWGEPGASPSPGSPTYHGPSALSEPESAAVAQLMDDHDYAFYASLHSGAEMILWPYGWTTQRPPELTLYNTLGSELQALTGAPHGQVSHILYGVSGDSMDQAYVGNDGWHAISVSPETYEGSGGAFDWWFLFNPPENNAAITPVVNRWMPFLWHLAAEAPLYAPATLDAPGSITIGPGSGTVAATATASAKRPFMDSSVAFDGNGAPLLVTTPNPVPLNPASGAQGVSFGLSPQVGGAYTTLVSLDAGPGGVIVAPIATELIQVGAAAALTLPTMGTLDTNTLAVSMDPGPFDGVAGTVEVTLLPEELTVGTASFNAPAGSPAQLSFDFTADGLAFGAHTARVQATYTVDDGGTPVEGEIVLERAFTVERPSVVATKLFAAASSPGEPLKVTVRYENLGNMEASGVTVRETVPLGYAYWVRDGPLPIPLDPLGKPAPSGVELRPDGGMDVLFELGNMAAGQARLVEYRILPVVPGTASLVSTWSYDGVYGAGTASYTQTIAPTHTTG